MQPAGAIGQVEDPSEGLMIRTEVERVSIQIWSKREDAPHHSKAFFLGGCVVLLRVREGAAPIPDR